MFLGNPRAAVDFTLPIRAQQVSDPVAEEFSLNTTFVLLSKRELWLADSQMQVTETSDVAFPEGLSIPKSIRFFGQSIFSRNRVFQEIKFIRKIEFFG